MHPTCSCTYAEASLTGAFFGLQGHDPHRPTAPSRRQQARTQRHCSASATRGASAAEMKAPSPSREDCNMGVVQRSLEVAQRGLVMKSSYRVPSWRPRQPGCCLGVARDDMPRVATVGHCCSVVRHTGCHTGVHRGTELCDVDVR
jgi:hypothetical protein